MCCERESVMAIRRCLAPWMHTPSVRESSMNLPFPELLTGSTSVARHTLSRVNRMCAELGVHGADGQCPGAKEIADASVDVRPHGAHIAAHVGAWRLRHLCPPRDDKADDAATGRDTE